MGRAGHFVQLHRRSGEFRAVVGFAGAYLFVLAAVAFFLPANRLAFLAVSAGTAQYLFAGWLPSGCLRSGGHHQSSGLPHLFAVAATTPGHGVRFTKFPACQHFNRIPRGAGHRDLSADHEWLRGLCAFP